MSGSETVDPDVLKALAGRLEQTMAPLFEQALEHLTETEIAGPAFSMDGVELQATYPGIRHFAMRDLESKAKAVESIIERLKHTAEIWEQTEQASTVTVH